MDFDEKQGAKTMDQLFPGAEKVLREMLDDTAPAVTDLTLGFIFGAVYNLKSIDLRTKEVVTLAVLAAQGYPTTQLAFHIRIALNLGITREEIIGIFTHLSVYAGFPATMNAIATAKTVFKSLDEPRA